MTSFVLAILPTAPPAPLHVEQEVHDVAILHEVFLAFGTHKTCFLGGVPAAVLEEVGVAQSFGADKASFKVRVDDTCALRCLETSVERPGAAFLFASGEECAQSEDFVTLTDHGVEARFLHAEFL